MQQTLRLSTTPYKLLGGLQLLDVMTTWILLDRLGHGVEGNPIVRSVFGFTGITLGLLIILAFKLLIVWRLYLKQTGVKFVGALYSAVLFNNALAIALVVT